VNQNKIGPISLRYRLRRSLETYVVRRADAVVGIAQSILQDMETRRIPAAKLFHVPNGVDVARFTPRPKNAVLAAQLGLGETPTLGFLGTLFPWEGISWLVRAAAVLHRKGLVFKLLIVGDGADFPEVAKTIREGDADRYVSLIGRVPHDQVELYYSVMDVMVYPRRSVRVTEFATPLKPLEAMALGKAVLASGVGGLRELIESEVTGVLFEPENVEDFCRKAGRLLLDEDLRRNLGENARRTVCVEKDWKVLTRRYESVYDAAIRNACMRA
jgi:glycogen synthase